MTMVRSASWQFDCGQSDSAEGGPWADRCSVFSRTSNRAAARTAPWLRTDHRLPSVAAPHVGGDGQAEALLLCAGQAPSRRPAEKPIARDISSQKPPQNAITIHATTTCERRRGRQSRVVATCGLTSHGVIGSCCALGVRRVSQGPSLANFSPCRDKRQSNKFALNFATSNSPAIASCSTSRRRTAKS